MANEPIMSIREWAAINYFTPEEFKREILIYAAIVGAMAIDEGELPNGIDTLKFKSADAISDIEVYVRRVYKDSSDDFNNKR